MLIGKYQFGGTLGRGSYAKVVNAVNIETGEQVAAKIMDRNFIEREGLLEYVKKEISVMWTLRHPSVVELKDVLVTKTNFFLILELVTGGELYAKVDELGAFTEDVARKCFRQLVSALEYCHARGVCHRDLKLENLLFDAGGNIKITDFGFSRHLNSQLRSAVGTPSYLAPEALEQQNYDGQAVDVWACGVILYIMAVGKYPFGDPDEPISTLYKRIKNAKYSLPDHLSPSFRSLLKNILQPNPQKRLTIEQIKQNDWFTGGSVGNVDMPVDSASTLPFQWPAEVEQSTDDMYSGCHDDDDDDEMMEDEPIDEWWKEEDHRMRGGSSKDPITLRWKRSN